ncbi:hypothetical protein EJB05_46365 [Eragrostis curvula]|uniref:Uncharacterized protein n=1 Tax=Eragrostis curvula TaxID=38414 RepID=A0A5J9TN28_9POAL|nr:hypothetical protein EJB05_46365 [Eragrostis curvula]
MSTVSRASLDQKLALAKRCSREATLAGTKAAAIATVASAVPTLASVRMLPWAKANLNPTGQALIICTVAGMAYFVAADKKILSLARRHSFEEAPDHLKNTSYQGLASVRMLPWAKANLNPTGQALIICTVAGMAYFVAADKKILSLARQHSFEEAPDHLKNTSSQGVARPHPAFFRP